ncbi:MAG: N-acetylmuramoyl-L-alanine amidase [Alphaproteobacteria bacterium]
MRDIIIARRAVLALAVAACVGVGPIRPAAARSPAERKPQHLRPLARSRPRVVALDPGHGGVDPGAISPHGIYEKTLTLATARELARQLDATGRYRPVLTRRGDTFVSLRERVARARAARADLFLSLHADALPDNAMRGLSVYTLSNEASDRVTAALAARENKDDFIAGVHLSHEPRQIGAILLDLARTQTNNSSLTLARLIVEELGRTVKLLERPHRAAGFAVLTAPDIPSALVELGCLSNPADERLLPQRAYQQRLAHGLARAIADYFATA